MRRLFCVGLLLTFACGALSPEAVAQETGGPRGDYVEVRTASVFAGACHYNGELTTAGREALMAWSVTSGSYGGVNLAGVRALAAVGGDSNLSGAGGARRAELIVDESATAAQAAAFVKAVEERYAATLGQVVAVRRARVGFEHKGKVYTVTAAGVASLTVEAMPDDLCCKMPQHVWYDPLVPLARRKVGYTRQASYAGGEAGDAWQRSGENGAFYGSFSF